MLIVRSLVIGASPGIVLAGRGAGAAPPAGHRGTDASPSGR